MSWCRWGPVIACLVLLVGNAVGSPSRGSSDGDAEDRWFELRIDDVACGWARTTETTDDDGRRTFEEEMSFRLRRKGIDTLVRARHGLVTSADGRLLRMSRTDWQGDDIAEVEWFFDGDEVTRRRSSAGRVETTSHPRPTGTWVASSELLRRAGLSADGSGSLSFEVIGPRTGLRPVERRLRSLPSDGSASVARRWEILEVDGSATIVAVDADGRMLRSRTPLGPGLGDFEMSLVNRASVPALESVGFEIGDRGVIRPILDPSVGRPDRGRSLSMHLRLEDGPRLELPTCGAQAMVVRDGVVEVEIDLERSTPLTGDPERWLSPTATLEVDDPEVVRFAHRAAPVSLDDWSTACRLRRAVHDHVRDRTYAVGFATAAQTVRSREGDCTEHAVLLAAALRVHGLPSRLVTGLVWVPSRIDPAGRFVWHMWVQVAIDGRWRDLDPTIRGDHHHPGHLAVATHDGTEEEHRRDHARILGLFGRGLGIEIVGRGRSLEHAP